MVQKEKMNKNIIFGLIIFAGVLIALIKILDLENNIITRGVNRL